MAELSNVIIVTEKPPKLGKITGTTDAACAQIRAFLVLRKKYIRRYKDSITKIPTLDQMMEEEDLEQLSRVAVARFKKQDRRDYPEEYHQRDLEDQESSSDSGTSESGNSDKGDDQPRLGSGNLQTDLENEGDDEGSPQRASQNVRTASQLINDRLRAFEKQLFSEENILRMLRVMYGPKDELQADDLLKQVKMDRNITPYRSLQQSTEYAAKFEETVQWIEEFKPDSKTLRDAFLSGIHPPELKRRLTLLRIKKLDRLIESFHDIYYDYFDNLGKLEAAGVTKYAHSSVGSNKSGSSGDGGDSGGGSSSKKKFVQWTTSTTDTPATASGTSSGTSATAAGNSKPAGDTAKKTAAGGSPDKARVWGVRKCFICDSEKHLALECPQRKDKTPEKAAASPQKQSRSFLRAGTVEPRACVACHIGAVGAEEPTLLVRANMDSLSDDNLIPEQWLVVLRGEGVEPVPLAEPIHLRWGVGNAEVVLRAYVEIAVRVLAWAGQEGAAPLRFYVIEAGRRCGT